MLGVGLSIPTIAVRGRRGVALEPETTAVLSRMTVAPDSTRQGHVNALIKSLKAAGVWDKLDCLYVMAAHDAQAARQNWKQSGFNLTPVNAPTFVIDRGYRGDGSTSYLGSGFTPSAAGGLFAANSAHLGAYPLTDSGLSNEYDVGATTGTNSYLNSRNGTTIAGRINDASGSAVMGAVASSIGHSVISRPTATERTSYRDGGPAFTVSGASSSGLVPTAEFRVLAGGGQFSTRRLAATHWGAALTGSDVVAIYSALQSYLTAVGAA